MWARCCWRLAWLSTHWLLRESGVWKDRNTDEVRKAQRHAEYSYRLAVDAAPAKELRFFGLAGWVTDRFVATRRRLYDLQYEATRLRERSVLTLSGRRCWRANLDRLLDVGRRCRTTARSPVRVVVFVQAAIGVSAIALRRIELGDSTALQRPLPRSFESRPQSRPAPCRRDRWSLRPAPRRSGSATCRSRYVDGGRPVLDGFDLTIPAGSSMAIVGQNGAGKTTLAKLLCRLYDTTSGSIEIDGQPLTSLELDAWRNTGHGGVPGLHPASSCRCATTSPRTARPTT